MRTTTANEQQTNKAISVLRHFIFNTVIKDGVDMLVILGRKKKHITIQQERWADGTGDVKKVCLVVCKHGETQRYELSYSGEVKIIVDMVKEKYINKFFEGGYI